jgi:hypothetical protein
MAMSNCSAKFVAAIFASMLAGSSFAAMAQDAAKETSKDTSAKTADTCLSGPKGSVPAGGHWYYRVDHATKRNCWYIGEDKNKSARTAVKDPPSATAASAPAASPAASPVAADPVLPRQTTNVRKSIADARAELTAPQARVEDLSEPPTTGAVPATGIANSQAATAPDATSPSSPVASRWPESSGVSPSSAPRLAAAEPPPSVQTPGQQAQRQETQSLQDNATPAPQPAGAPVALAAADSSPDRPSESMQMLLLTMAGALALAGITASLVFRFGRTRLVQPEILDDRRPIWDSVHVERRSPSMFPDEDMLIEDLPIEDSPIWRRDPPPRNVPRNLPRDPRAPDDPERRVTEMLARLARSAQT